MLHALNTSLENFLRAEVPLPVGQVDVEFRAPDRDWAARLTRPTLNVFLHEVRRSTSRSVTGAVTRQANGVYAREMLSPFVRVRWCISLWTPEPADEHRVLGEVLSVVVTTGGIPDIHLVEPLRWLGNGVELTLAGEDARPSSEVWTGLGVPPRLAVELIGVLPVAPPLSRTVPAPPADVHVGVGDQHEPGRRSDIERAVEPAGEAAEPGEHARRLGATRRSTVEDLGRSTAVEGA